MKSTIGGGNGYNKESARSLTHNKSSKDNLFIDDKECFSLKRMNWC